MRSMPTELLAKPEILNAAISNLWQAGKLRFKLQPKQREAYDKLKSATPEEIFFLLCHRGFGKTFIASTIANETARKETDGNILIISSTLKKLRTVVKPAFDEILSDCPEELKPTYNSQDSYYQYPNGIRAHLIAAEKGHIEEVRGVHKVVLVLIDEAAFFGDEGDSYPLDYVIEHILNPMFIRTKSTPRIVMMTTPPEVPNHPTKKYFEEAKTKNCVAIYDILNTDITPEKVEEQRRRCKDPLAWRREYLCEWVIDETRLIFPEWNQKYVQEIAHDEFFPFFHKYHALDTGVRDFTVDLMGYYEFTKARLVIEDEILLKGAEVRTDFLADQIKQKEKDLKYDKVYRRIGDNNNLIILQDLSGIHKLPFMPTTKDDLFAMVNEVRLWINAGRLILNPRVKYTIGCLENGIWDKNKKEFARSTTFGHFDALAALCYLIRHVDTNTNPIPADFEFSLQTKSGFVGKAESPNYKAFRQAIKLPIPQRTTDDWRKRAVA